MSFSIDPDCALLTFDPQCGGAHIENRTAGSILRTALFLSAASEFCPSSGTDLSPKIAAGLESVGAKPVRDFR
jgi:hypothetical protein